MSGRTFETLGRGSWYLGESLSLDLWTSHQILKLKPSAGYNFLVKISFQLFTFKITTESTITVNTLNRSYLMKHSQYHRWSQLLIKKIAFHNFLRSWVLNRLATRKQLVYSFLYLISSAALFVVNRNFSNI